MVPKRIACGCATAAPFSASLTSSLARLDPFSSFVSTRSASATLFIISSFFKFIDCPLPSTPAAPRGGALAE